MGNQYLPLRVANASVRVSASMLTVLIVVALAAPGMPSFLSVLFSAVSGYLIAATFIGVITGLVLIPVARTQVRGRVIETRAHMCPKCAYDLTARQPDDHTCPECGLVCPRRECVRLWCKLLRSRI
ncbi:MAG: hypothetical protein AAGA55_08345 [Planctomycetota bacterium]